MGELAKPRTAVEVLGPPEQAQVANLIRRATLAAGLSPWEQHKIEWQLRRQRGALILQLAEVEAQTVVAEAIVMAEGRVEAAREAAAVATFTERLRCLLAAGEVRDDALSSAMQLSEGSREVIAGAIDRVTARYLRGVEKRAGRMA